MEFLFHLVLVFISHIFQRISLFHPSDWIFGHDAVHNISIYCGTVESYWVLIINRIGSVLSHSNLDQYPKVLLMETNQFQRFTSYPIPFIGHSQNAKYSNGVGISWIHLLIWTQQIKQLHKKKIPLKETLELDKESSQQRVKGQ